MAFFWSTQPKGAVEQNERPDFSSMSKDELLDQFKSENWSELYDEDRIAIFQEIENRNAEQQGREPAQVVGTDSGSYYGCYNGKNNRMEIDVSNGSSFEALDTYVHESNHAYQEYCIANGINSDDHALGMMEVEMARNEQGYLYNYESDGLKNDMQCCELDSNNKAAAALLAEQERFKNDPDYKQYIADREKHFSEVNAGLENRADSRMIMQSNQVYKSYVMGDISEEQYNALSANVLNENYEDSTVQESKAIGETISQLNSELNVGQNHEADDGVNAGSSLEGSGVNTGSGMESSGIDSGGVE